ncbi:MAG: AMP-binding protein, partial [Pseudomonadota bacterium]
MGHVLSGFWRDLKFGMRLIRVLRLFSDLDPRSHDTITQDIEGTVDRSPEAIAFFFEGRTFTYRNIDQRANRVAQWALGQNLRRGDCVALNLENCPDFVIVWYGLSKVGVICALINTNLKDEGLEHCIRIVDAKAVISAGLQAERSLSCLKARRSPVDVWDFDGANGRDFEAALAGQKEVRPSATHRQGIRSGDTALYIYTSGTTGLPKAARITHNKLRGTGRIAKALVQIKRTDRVYNALPLYHITGGGIGLIGPLSVGASVILKRRFSAGEFWQDIAENRATLFVYIGELCRYLVNAAPHPSETSHCVRAGFGNGLRAEVWRSFVDRFGVPTMRELYGSTEGNVSFLNLDGTVGAIGQMPPWIGKRI